MRTTWMLLLLLALPAAAQEGDIATLLDSKEARDRAWGAHKAAEQKDAAMQPRLIELLEDEAWQVRNAALDGLVRTRAKVAWKSLEPLYARFPAQVAILLALHPKHHQKPMLDLLKRESAVVYWLTYCNHLARQRTPGFADYLLSKLTLQLHVTVFDPNDRLGGIGLGGGAGGGYRGRGGRRNLTAGWPPLVTYRVTKTPIGAVLSPGKRPTYYARVNRGPMRIPGLIREDWCMEYLSDLVGAAFKRTHYAAMAFDIPPVLAARLDKERSKMVKDYERLLQLLQRRKLLTEQEAERRPPRIRITVSDSRKSKVPPLPKFR